MYFSILKQIFLPVSDLNASKEWYKEHFNLKEARPRRVGNGDLVELCFESTSFWIVKHTPLNKYTHIPFNFHTNKIKEIHQELISKGVTVTKITDDGECFDFYDPDGNRLGFCFESTSTNQQYTEIGTAFLPVRNLSRSVQWYKENFGYDFFLFSATGGAGVIWPTLEYKSDVTIHYAGVTNKSFHNNKGSGVCFVETPECVPLSYKPYSIQSSNIHNVHETLRSRGVVVSEIITIEDRRSFHFIDIDGYEIEIVQDKY